MCSMSVFSQEKYTKHTVVKGETISQIAKDYKVKPEAIFELNPGSKKGIQVKSVLLIPAKPKKGKKNVDDLAGYTEITHTVKPKETLYGIAKQYNISLKLLRDANEKADKNGLSIGQKIVIPVKRTDSQKPSEPKEELKSDQKDEAAIAVQNPGTENNKIITHTILPNETKYGIAKQYGISIRELETWNPEIADKFPVGYVLNIQSNQPQQKVIVVAEEQEITPADSSDSSKSVANTELIDQLISTASDKIGTRYRSGGTTTKGFDCSGLMCNTFGAYNIILPRSSIEQSQYGVKIKTEEARKGDLIFFKTNGKRHINHVGMIVEVTEEEIKFIHSTNHKGVIISSTKETYYDKNLVQVNRVIK